MTGTMTGTRSMAPTGSQGIISLMAGTNAGVPPYRPRNRIGRSGPAIRAALDSELRAEFDAEFRLALGQADDDFDLAAVQRVLDRWWPQAVLCANPEIQVGVNEDRRRITAGDTSVFGKTTTYPHARQHD